jgi:hypothetical protein
VTIARTSSPTPPAGEAPVADLPAVADDGLLCLLDDAAGARPRASIAGCAALAVVVGTAVVAGGALAAVVALLVVPALVVVRHHDRARRTVTATYARPHRVPSSCHEQLVATWERHRVAATSWEPAVWEVAPHGGHHAVVRRVDGPRHLRADVPVPTFAAAHHDVAFLPDRVVIREGSRHRGVSYDELEVAATVRERDGGGRIGRLSLRVTDRTLVYDLTSVGAACDLAAALRGMTGPGPRRALAAARPLVVPSPREGAADGARDAVGPTCVSPTPSTSAQSVETGSPWASPTVAL